MSRAKKQSGEEPKLILLSTTGAREEIAYDPNRTLIELKNIISQSKALGCLAPANQRIFHTGRELKTGGRSLEKLAVTRFGINVIHVHAKVKNTEPASTTAVARRIPAAEVEESSSTEPRNLKSSTGVIDLASDEDDDDDDVVEVIPPQTKRQRVA